MTPIVIRPASVDDAAFVISSYLKSQRNEGHNALMSNDVYYARVKPRVERMIARDQVIVACSPEDAWHLYGWLAYEPGVVHYAYVKFPYRRFGIGRALFAKANPSALSVIATHSCRDFPAIRDKFRLLFDPEGGAI